MIALSSVLDMVDGNGNDMNIDSQIRPRLLSKLENFLRASLYLAALGLPF